MPKYNPNLVANPQNLLIGCDPEVFVFDVRQDKYISAHDLIPGTKAAPHPVDKGAVQVDGMALEFNIDPARTPEEFAANTKRVIDELKTMLPNHLYLAAKPTVEFGAEYMETVPEEAKELGCEPDFNAYAGGAENPRPNGEATFRTGAGHIHIGWGEGFSIDDPQHVEVCCIFAKQLDYYLGVALGLTDPDTKRRELYGNKGAFRPKSYGMEYRPLSNAWLRDEELYVVIPQLVYRAWDNLQRYYPNTRCTGEVEQFFGRSKLNTSKLETLQRKIKNDTGFKIDIHPDYAGVPSGEVVEFENNPFNYTFTRDQIWLSNFDEVAPYLEEMGIEWADGSKPTEYAFDEGFVAQIFDGRYLRLDVGERTLVNLLDYLPKEEGVEESSMVQQESQYFI